MAEAHPLSSETEATLEVPIGRRRSCVYDNDDTTFLIACSSMHENTGESVRGTLKKGRSTNHPSGPVSTLLSESHSTRSPDVNTNSVLENRPQLHVTKS